MTSAFSWQNSVSLALLHSVLQGQICLFLLPTFAVQSRIMKILLNIYLINKFAIKIQITRTNKTIVEIIAPGGKEAIEFHISIFHLLSCFPSVSYSPSLDVNLID